MINMIYIDRLLGLLLMFATGNSNLKHTLHVLLYWNWGEACSGSGKCQLLLLVKQLVKKR
jgi:hypothetical protein